jgi:pimeloyl-ACP methyl ester carboxylesterase
MNFRQMMIGGLLAAVAAFLLPTDVKSQAATTGVKNIVLAHGAFADGSSWAKVISLLQEKGYRVIAVQNPLTSFDDDVAATKRAIALTDGPVLLVGHSYAGMVITEAGVDPKVAGLVYVAALIPKLGQSVVDVNTPFPAAAGGAEIRPDSAGYLSMTFKGIEEDFAQDAPSAEQKVIFATQVPWAASALQHKVSDVAWKTKPSWCIIATHDRMITPDQERATAKMINAKTLEINTNHVVMVTEPKKVASFIMEAAAQLSDK